MRKCLEIQKIPGLGEIGAGEERPARSDTTSVGKEPLRCCSMTRRMRRAAERRAINNFLDEAKRASKVVYRRYYVETLKSAPNVSLWQLVAAFGRNGFALRNRVRNMTS